MQFRRQAAFRFGGTELLSFLLFLRAAPFLLGDLGFEPAAAFTERNHLFVCRRELFLYSLSVFANVGQMMLANLRLQCDSSLSEFFCYPLKVGADSCQRTLARLEVSLETSEGTIGFVLLLAQRFLLP